MNNGACRQYQDGGEHSDDQYYLGVISMMMQLEQFDVLGIYPLGIHKYVKSVVFFLMVITSGYYDNDDNQVERIGCLCGTNHPSLR